MKFRAYPLVYRAVMEGVVEGLKRAPEISQQPEHAEDTDIIPKVISATVMQSLESILSFEEIGEPLEVKEPTDE